MDDQPPADPYAVSCAAQTPGRHTPPAIAPRLQFSSWLECSTRTGAGIVPEVTGASRREPDRPTNRDWPTPQMGQSFGFVTPASTSQAFQTRELGLAMVVMTMVAVMRCRGKRRTSEHHHQKHSSDELFHGLNVARSELWKHARRQHESSEQTIRPIQRQTRPEA